MHLTLPVKQDLNIEAIKRLIEKKDREIYAAEKDLRDLKAERVGLKCALDAIGGKLHGEKKA